MTQEQALRDARLRSGGLTAAKEAYRDRSTLPILEDLIRDTFLAVRKLRQRPLFAATSLLMLAIGVAASMTLFAFVDGALLQPLPYRDPNRLMDVTETTGRFRRANLSYLDYLDWKKLNRVFNSFDAYTGGGYLLNTGTVSMPIPAARVTDGFFRTLGVTPALGRDFYAGEDLPGKPDTVILTDAAWHKRFGGAKDVIGRTVRLSGVPHTIVGVLPSSFQFAPRGDAELWTPLHASSSCETNRACHDLYGVGRLREGITMQAALANLTSIAAELERRYPGSNREQGATVQPLAELIAGDVRPILLMLLCGGALLLLIACVNIASLLLAHSESRRRELAVRSSLGASRGRLLSQFVTEALVLVIAGAGSGFLLTGFAVRGLVRLIPEYMLAGRPYLESGVLTLHGLVMGAVLTMLMAAWFTIIPSVHLHLSDLQTSLAEGSRGSAGRMWRRLGSNLVIIELAIALVLLVAAGLLTKSVSRLTHVELNLVADHLAVLDVAVPAYRYPKDEQVTTFTQRMLEQLRALPGVVSIGLATDLPVNFNGNTDWIRFAGKPYHGEHNEVNERDVTGDYLRTLKAPLLRGRYFSDVEDASKPRVAIVNEALARQYFPGEDPIGKRFGNTDLKPDTMKEIVGVVADVREGSLDSPIWPAEYLPFNQNPARNFSVAVRTVQAEETILPLMMSTIRRLDPEVGIMNPGTLNQRIDDSPSSYLHRLSAFLVAGFAGIALLLGVVGLYGVVAYSVSQRTREIGIRMALGAEQRSVSRLILREAGRLTAAGIAGGLVCALFATTLMKKILFGVTAWDVPTLASVVVFLAVVSLLASYIPARRAARVNPVEALRTE
jgi:predicted permease